MRELISVFGSGFHIDHDDTFYSKAGHAFQKGQPIYPGRSILLRGLEPSRIMAPFETIHTRWR